MCNESLSGGNPSEKSASSPADDRGIAAARSSEGGNARERLPGVTIQSCEPVDSNPVSVGAASLEQSIGAKGVDPHRPLSNDYCRQCGSFDIVPYVR